MKSLKEEIEGLDSGEEKSVEENLTARSRELLSWILGISESKVEELGGIVIETSQPHGDLDRIVTWSDDAEPYNGTRRTECVRCDTILFPLPLVMLRLAYPPTSLRIPPIAQRVAFA